MNYRSWFRTSYQIAKRPAVLGVIIHDFLNISNPICEDQQHLEAMMHWLCRAQDVTGCGGVSMGWFVKHGWLPPYPETTGYLIPTFLQYASLSGKSTFFDRAIKMGNWELEIQFPTGAFPSSVGSGRIPLVFDTGQVLQGLTALFRATDEIKWLDAAVRAAKWIVSIQDKDGSWRNGAHNNIHHAYYTRVAWPLFELADLTGTEEFRKSAQAHINWVLSLRHPNGWIDDMGFLLNDDPLTHTLAYTYEGLFESMKYVSTDLGSDIFETIVLAMNNVVEYQQPQKIRNYKQRAMPGLVNEDWQFYGSFSCLVGNSQLALLLLRLYEVTHKSEYWDVAMGILSQVKSTQVFTDKDQDLHGAIGGAQPLWGGYGSLSFINWAGKFFADALMLKSAILNAQQEHKTL
jgi:hypothetical protein